MQTAVDPESHTHICPHCGRAWSCEDRGCGCVERVYAYCVRDRNWEAGRVQLMTNRGRELIKRALGPFSSYQLRRVLKAKHILMTGDIYNREHGYG